MNITSVSVSILVLQIPPHTPTLMSPDAIVRTRFRVAYNPFTFTLSHLAEHTLKARATKEQGLRTKKAYPIKVGGATRRQPRFFFNGTQSAEELCV